MVLFTLGLPLWVLVRSGLLLKKIFQAAFDLLQNVLPAFFVLNFIEVCGLGLKDFCFCFYYRAACEVLKFRFQASFATQKVL